MDQTIARRIMGVNAQQAQSTGRTWWTIDDDQGQEWKCWEAQAAMDASTLQQSGQLGLLLVSITQARDPQYGMNYRLKKVLGLAPEGTVPQPLQEPQMGMQPQPLMPVQGPQMGVQQQPGFAGMPQPAGPMPLPQPAVAQPPMPPQIVKTMGQGGNYSDADLTRMARSIAINAVVGAAFVPEDFRDEEDLLSWERVYAVAEAATKFILQRAHEGWVPGVEINPTTLDAVKNEAEVLAEVQAQFPGTTTLGVDEPSEGDDDGSDVPWDS